MCTGFGTNQTHTSELCNPVLNKLWITQSISHFRTSNIPCKLRNP